MPTAIAAFALGVFALQQQAVLPDPAWLLGLALLGLAGFAIRRPPWWWFAAALLGFSWAGLRADWRLADALPPAWEGRDLVLIGSIAEMPQSFERGLRFVFHVEEASGPAPRKIALSWYRGDLAAREQDAEDEATPGLPIPHAGERWRFKVRLKRPHGTLNFAGFDYEAWLFERGIRATGYVRKGAENQRLEPGPVNLATAVERLRERIRTRILTAVPASPAGGILAALAIGDQNAIPAEYWQLFAATGITHLMSISGLHVTLIGVLVGWLVFQLWRRHPRLPLFFPAQSAGLVATFLGAAGYALLAGLGIPTQRTLIMLAVAVVALLSRRAVLPMHVLAGALFVVLVIDPWAVLAPGFWLSFGAVAFLFYVAAGRLARGHWLFEALRAQWAVTLGLLPALLVLFQQFSLVSPLANALAIPLVSFLITPLALAGGLIGLDFLLAPAAWLIDFLLTFLRACAALPGALWQQAQPPSWAILLALVGVLGWLLPRGLPARWLGAVFLLPALSWTPPRPAEGEAWLTVLDVGQGLAVHVQTAQHDLLYDTGPAWGEFDAGSRIVLPALRAEGVSRLDALIVSHDDRDHAGGAAAILRGLPVAMWIAPPAVAKNSALERRPCLAGMSWTWDGVRFTMLHPTGVSAEEASDNAQSCVLKIETAAGARALLPGDLEGRAEMELVQRASGQLAAEVLVAAHHGARKTASKAFLDAVAPELVIIPVGYRNRFRHPHPATLERLQEAAREVWRSDWHGAVRVRLATKAEILAHARAERRRYWHNLPATFAATKSSSP